MAHFIDNDWKLNKNVLNFCPISSHRGEAIGKAVEKCLIEWEIDKVFTITVDNASSNNVAITYLKRKISNWETYILDVKLLHMRCIAHIINLVVNDGLKEMGKSISCAREAVRYVRQSSARLQKFKEFVKVEKIQSKSLLYLNVSTRWNSTYLMLDAAQKFERVFERFEDHDSQFRSEFEMEDGIPTCFDWENVRRLVLFLQYFYNLIVRVSGSLYVTSNNFVHEINVVKCLLQKWVNSDDKNLREMAKRMKGKYDKYWGNIEKMNKLIYITIVLDPRHKLEYVEFVLNETYQCAKGHEFAKRVREALYELYNEYKSMFAPQSGSGQTIENVKCSILSEIESEQPQQSQAKKILTMSQFKKYKSVSRGGDAKSELDKYLNEDTKHGQGNDDFDIFKMVES
ncbi:PREDICTED: zinc finger BED domain-containing protein RICESLEEPER 2-like [Nelumbo nucifera]|uniref:Zinc finger BED domain-containing protein RICESLEEPER 2-like n=1 Tax=Nelumbo nucifera TaxID=4432 RepID=A0A1U8ALS1_NELNU|nr:PREDICTED: zinc finger BED domain-containing protein RICESLEEPER 2-like [Nelumbo nucifera]